VTRDEQRIWNLKSEIRHAEARRVRGPTVREGSSKCGVRNSECGIPVQKPDRKGGRYSVTSDK